MPLRLYAVLRLRSRRGGVLPAGIRKTNISLLRCGTFAAAVSEDQKSGITSPSIEDLIDFDRAIRRLAGVSDAILPARYGSTSPNASGASASARSRTSRSACASVGVAGRTLSIAAPYRIRSCTCHVSRARARARIAASSSSRPLQPIARKHIPAIFVRAGGDTVGARKSKRD